MMDDVLVMQGVTRDYPVGGAFAKKRTLRALRGIDLTVSRGRTLGLVGESGCGKSTVLKLASGLLRPTAGTVSVRGELGYVFQDPTLMPWRTLIGNVGYLAELNGVGRVERRRLAQQAIDRVNLSGFEKHYPRQLSGGMRMRVSLARALVTQPEILLLDEPFAALDDLLRQRLNEDLLRIWQSENWTVVFVTHNISDAVFLSQEVHVMSDKPGTIGNTRQIPFPYPRDSSLRTTLEFAQLTESLSALLGKSKP